jgi:type IV pilus assembly protein PilV
MRGLKWPLAGKGGLRTPGTQGRRSQERGFSLIEALVAVLIVAIGLLGMGQLTLTGLRESAAALTRTEAVYLISDMMERIRANPDARDAYDCASYVSAPAERGCAPSGAPAIQCTARELAEDDLARWQSLARDALPLAAAGACNPNVAYLAAAAGAEPSKFRVEVSWRQPGSEVPLTLSGELLLDAGRPA